jgi:hypothetical protein
LGAFYSLRLAFFRCFTIALTRFMLQELSSKGV